MKITLRIIGLVGTLLFSTFLYFTYSVPGYVEEVGKDFIKQQVKKKTNAKIDSLTINKKDNAFSKIAGKLLEKNKARIDSVKQNLKDKTHEKLADIIAEMRNLDCECRNKHAALIKKQYQLNLSSLQVANDKLKDFMRTRYMEVVTELKRDVRIFTGSNTLIFLLLLIVSFLKPKAIAHLFLPGVLLVTSTAVCSYFYVFEQDWILTIIYNNYLGYGYLAYIGVLFAILCDIVFNKASVTTEIINAILHAIGSAFEVVPC